MSQAMGEAQGAAGGRGGRRVRVTWVKSAIGYRESQRLTIKSLGLRRLHQTVEHYDSPSIRGMLNKVQHLVRIEEIDASEPVAPRRETGSQRFQRRLQAKAAAREALIAEFEQLAAEHGARTQPPVAAGSATQPAVAPVAAVAAAQGVELDSAPAPAVGTETRAVVDAAELEDVGVTPTGAAASDPAAVAVGPSFGQDEPVATGSAALEEAAEDEITEGGTVVFRPSGEQR